MIIPLFNSRLKIIKDKVTSNLFWEPCHNMFPCCSKQNTEHRLDQKPPAWDVLHKGGIQRIRTCSLFCPRPTLASTGPWSFYGAPLAPGQSPRAPSSTAGTPPAPLSTWARSGQGWSAGRPDPERTQNRLSYQAAWTARRRYMRARGALDSNEVLALKRD